MLGCGVEIAQLLENDPNISIISHGVFVHQCCGTSFISKQLFVLKKIPCNNISDLVIDL